MRNYKILIINIIAVVLIYFFCKYILIFCLISAEKYDFKHLIRLTNEAVLLPVDYETFYKRHQFVPTVIPKENNGKKPIVIFGCSFAEGLFLPNEEKFSYRLYESTGREIHNRAYCAQGLQYMLYQLEDEKFYQEVPEPEYVVYVFIEDHIRRLYRECCPWIKSLFYKVDENGKLKKIDNLLYHTFPMMCVRKLSPEVSDYDKAYKFLRQHFIYAKELADKHWKNTKWIILVYEDIPLEYFEELKKYGYTIAPAKDLVPSDFYTNLKYRLSATDEHPSKDAWLTLTPKFAKKYIK